MFVGYARVSTQDQNLDSQIDALRAAGCQLIFEEKMSGTRIDRPELMAAIDYMQPGDTLVVWKLSRLGRSLKQTMDTVDRLVTKGIALKSLHESIDINSATGTFVLQMLAALAQLEAANGRENTKAGLAAARARGRIGGRKRIMTSERMVEALAVTAAFPDMPVKQRCEKLGISESTYYRYRLFEQTPSNDNTHH